MVKLHFQHSMLILLMLFLYGCNSTFKKQSQIKESTYTPPGCVKISENLFADKTELTNIGYREYQFWNKKIFGKESNEYRETIIDTSVWKPIEELSFLSESYFRELEFINHPVVGITLKQAKLYSDWRTNRVMETILIRAKIISHDPFQTATDYFTFEKFINGEYVHIIGQTEYNKNPIIIEYPVYKIPTASEWETISGIEKDQNKLPKNVRRHNKKVLKKYGRLEKTKEFNHNLIEENKQLKDPKNLATSNVYSLGQNKFGMFGIVGNVSELIDKNETCKGENWTSSRNEFNKEKNKDYSSPNAWTGFRNVCYVKRIELKDGRKTK